MQPSRLVSLALSLSLLGLTACPSGRPKEGPAAPTITFESPRDGAYVHGAISIRAVAKGVTGIKDFRFTTPAALTSALASFDAATNSGTLEASYDVSSLSDGPVKLTVTAQDALGGTTTGTLTLNVAQLAPSIQVLAPVANGTVKGSVSIAASATSQPGTTITSLQLITPPSGATGDILPSPDSYSASWDTTSSPEGTNVLHFRAIDSSGLAGDYSVTVNVDNVPLAVVTTHLSAGAPIQGALIDVLALSDGCNVDTTQGSNGLIGTGGPTDTSGKATIPITAENYQGPLKLVARASPGTTLSYIDPSNPPSNISIPTALSLTSILPDHTPGTNVTTAINLWTTLAATELCVYANGGHRHFSGSHAIPASAAFADELFTAHLQKTPGAWSLHASIPSLLTQGPTQTLTDRAYAAFPDVALNQLAKDIGIAANVPGVITAPALVDLFQQDLAGDGQVDGLGPGAVQLTTPGRPGLPLDEDFLRNRLASALDGFIASNANQSGLSRSDLDGAGIYNAISTDISELFGSKTPTSFDNQGPSITLSATYGSSSPPVGALSYVRGTLQLTAISTDSSGVASISVRVGNTLLSGQTTAGPNGSLTWTGAYDSTAGSDGPIVVSASATDNRSNTASSSLSLAIDNTPPLVTHAAPNSSASYSDSIPFDVTATDSGSGVASLSHSGYPGLLQADQDSAIAHWLGTWTLPSPAPADGGVAGSFRACDAVGNCAVHSLPVTIDRTPPTLTWTVTPPTYTSSSSYVVSVTPSDATGIRSVTIQNGASTVQAVQNSNTWSAPLTLLAGTNTVRVWADDTSTPANSGSGRGTPSELSASIFYDSQPPAVALESTPSYQSEELLTVATNADGTAITPPTYQLTSSRTTLSSGTHIFKSAARLHCGGSPPDPAYLRSTNTAYNVPFAVFGVPLNSAFDSPITSATVTFEATCPGCTASTTTALLVDPATSASKALYLAPLCLEVVPWLDQLPAAAPVRITANVQDASGRTGTASLTITFHLMGAPIAAAEDSAYQAAGDPKAAAGYRLTNGTYGPLFDAAATTFQPEEQVRLTRVVLTNPNAVPAVVSVDGGTPTLTFSERWTGQNTSTTAIQQFDSFPTGGNCAGIGSWSFSGCYEFDWTQYLPLSFVQQSTGGGGFFTAGCGGVRTATGNVWLAVPNTVTPTIDSRSPSILAYQASTSTPYDFAQAPAFPGLTNSFIIPAANGSSPGRLHLYVVRPRTTIRPVITDATYTVATSTTSTATLIETLDLNTFTGGSYRTWRWSSWLWDGVNRDCGTGPYKEYAETQHWSLLSSSTESFTASIGLATSPVASSGTAVVGESKTHGAVSINRTITH
jgi:hypothetical protein